MRFLFLIFAFAAHAHATTAGYAFAGTSQRDGQANSQAWFVSDAFSQEVHICAQAPTPEEASEIVWKAHSAHFGWIRYFYRDIGRKPLAPGEPHFRNLGRVNETCTGTEDLTIYYGVENERVRAAAKLYDHPTAFAHLESYDEQTGRGKGFIWVAHTPEIQLHPRHRLAIIIHEMGHVFGLDHIEGTIMDEKISSLLEAAYREGKPLTPEGAVTTDGEPVFENWIDLRREAVAWSVIRLRAVREEMVEGSERDRAIALLTGEKVRGAFELRFYDKHNWRDETDNYTETGKGQLVVLGNSCIDPNFLQSGRWRHPCQWQFKVVYGPIVSLPVGEQQLFRRVFRGKTYSQPLHSSMQTGYFLDSSERKTEFVLTRNLGEKVDLSLVVKGEKIRLY